MSLEAKVLSAEEKSEITVSVIEQVALKYDLPKEWAGQEFRVARDIKPEPEFKKELQRELLSKLYEKNPQKAKAFELELILSERSLLDQSFFPQSEEIKPFISGTQETFFSEDRAFMKWAEENSGKLATMGITVLKSDDNVVLLNEKYVPGFDKRTSEILTTALQDPEAVAAVTLFIRIVKEQERSPDKFIKSQFQSVLSDIQSGDYETAAKRAFALNMYREISLQDFDSPEFQKAMKQARSLLRKSKVDDAVATLNIAGTMVAVQGSVDADTLTSYLEKARILVTKGKTEKAGRINRLVIQHIQFSQLSSQLSLLVSSAQDMELIGAAVKSLDMFRIKGEFSEERFQDLMGISYEEFKKRGAKAILESVYRRALQFCEFGMAKVKESLKQVLSGKPESDKADQALSKVRDLIAKGQDIHSFLSAIWRVRGMAASIGKMEFSDVSGLRARGFLQNERSDAVKSFGSIESSYFMALFHRVSDMDPEKYIKSIPRFEKIAASKAQSLIRHYNISVNFENYARAYAKSLDEYHTSVVGNFKKMRDHGAGLYSELKGTPTGVAADFAKGIRDEFDDSFIPLMVAQGEFIQQALSITISGYTPDSIQFSEGRNLGEMFGEKPQSVSPLLNAANKINQIASEASGKYKGDMRQIEIALYDLPESRSEVERLLSDPVFWAPIAVATLGKGPAAASAIWRALPETLKFGLSAGSFAYGSIELGSGTVDYLYSQTAQEQEAALGKIRGGAITVGMGAMGLSSLKLFGRAAMTATELGTLGIGSFVLAKDLQLMKAQGETKPLTIAMDMLLFLPALPLATKGITAYRASNLKSSADELGQLIELTVGTTNGEEVLAGNLVTKFLSRSESAQNAILEKMVAMGRGQAAARLNYLRGLQGFSRSGMISDTLYQRASASVLQDASFEVSEKGMLTVYDAMAKEGAIAGLNAAYKHPGADYLGVISSNVNRLIEEGKILFGGKPIPAGSISQIEFKFGGKGAFNIVIKLNNGKTTSVIMKLEDLAAEGFGSALVSDAGIISPQVMSASGGKPLTYMTPEGPRQFGLIEHMGKKAISLDGVQVEISSMETVSDLSSFIANNQILASLKKIDPLALQKLLMRALGYVQTGSINVGAIDGTAVNLPVMLGKINPAGAQRLLSSSNYLLYEEGATAQGALSTAFTNQTQGIVMKAKDGSYYMMSMRSAIGRLDCETSAMFYTVKTSSGYDMSPTLTRFARDMAGSVKSILSEFGSTAYSSGEMQKDIYLGGQHWYQNIGRYPEFQQRVAAQIAGHNGGPIGLATEGRLPKGFVSKYLSFLEKGKITPKNMSQLEEWLLSPAGGRDAYDDWLKTTFNIKQVDDSVRTRYLREISNFIQQKHVNGNTVSVSLPDGRLRLDAQAAIDSFSYTFSVGQKSLESGKGFGYNYWKEIFRLLPNYVK